MGSTAVVMDGAGDVVVIWEAIHGHDCNKVCTLDSLGIFATVRPAGGAFGAPVRLSAGRAYGLAEPRVVMNRAGDWLVMMKQGPGMVIGAGTGATAPGAFAALPLPASRRRRWRSTRRGTLRSRAATRLTAP